MPFRIQLWFTLKISVQWILETFDLIPYIANRSLNFMWS